MRWSRFSNVSWSHRCGPGRTGGRATCRAGEDTSLSHGERARVFDVAGVVGPVDAAVVVVQSAVSPFSRGALHDVAAQGTYDQAAQGIPGRANVATRARWPCSPA